jgi:penicillin V acylase-like amidase (Ntn superfamily)
MKRTLLILLLAAIFIASTSCQLRACSTFCYRDGKHLLVAKNFDFYVGDGHVIINKRAVLKVSFPMPGECQINWTSKYGSISFNQIGREFPFGGINEKGLVVEQMYLADTKYPAEDNRAGVAEMQWVQYQLDNSATLAEVLASDSILRISKYSAPIHFLVVDAMSNVATIEFVNGQTVVHKNSSLPVCALTNDTYAESVNYFNSEGRNAELNFKPTSFQRFARTGKMLEHFQTSRPVDYSFDILKAVKQGDFTKWSIVYDIKEMTIYFETSNNTVRRTLKMRDFDFACNTPVLYANIDVNIKNPNDFSLSAPSANLAIIERTFQVLATKPEFVNLIPSREEQRAMANYPDTMHCGE